MKTRTLGVLTVLLGLALITLAVYQAQVGGQVKVVAWYDMNGDGVIDVKDFDMNGDGYVTWVDVQIVQNTVTAKAYVVSQDFNRDGKVNQTDVEIIKAWMGKGKMALYDMNGDGIVDWHDLDVNNDGTIDIHDIATLGVAYGSKIGEPKYNPLVDFNQDGVIDDSDMNLIKPYYGYPLSIIDLFNVANPLSQLFIAGIIVTILGIITILRGGKT